MRFQLTPAVARAVEAAGPGASPAELLLALLDEEEGLAAQRLLRGAASLEPIRLALRAAPPEGDPTSINLILDTAGELAVELSGEMIVGGDHILLAVIRHDATVRAALEAGGANLAAIHDPATASEPLVPVDETLDLSAPAETNDTTRILDAAANRAREALRVVEDYARFVLNDACLCRELKQLRHDLAATLEQAGPLPWLAARDTPGDVGTGIGTDREGRRDSPLQVAQVNLKRLQEALRSLEEFGKIVRPELGAAVEQIRYRAYTLERMLVLGTQARERLADARLYLLLTAANSATTLEFVIAEAAAGGVDIVQLREKELSDRHFLARARQVRGWTRRAGVLFIVNDRPDIARLAEADGVHLGQDDMPVTDARRVLGSDALIGVSTHSLEQLRQAVRDGASYAGVGPIFSSKTKAFEEFPGLEFVRRAAAETTLPMFALGGITADNVGSVVEAGLRRVAVSSAICAADEPRPVAAAIKRQLK